ncbi:MAG: Flp pilus assembly complex ATPase component TadA [Verrucomicrobia bacterium]|nr:Flp pilus assembly complex ATPase component TadA [Verrucomicrobiota bacterium]
MSNAESRWSQIVEFVRTYQPSDLSFSRGDIWARLDGRMVSLSEQGALTQEDVREMIGGLLNNRPDLKAHLRETLSSADFTSNLSGKRFRVNIAQAQGQMFASLRPLPDTIPTLSEVGITPKMEKSLLGLTEGLLLVSGPTGSGKTTTIAACLEAYNQKHQFRIITIEDPVEFLFEPKQSEIIQREIGLDVASYAQGLREALRQNPNIIFVGEIRDAETATVALQAAETGHLVIASVHASDVPETITRFLLLLPESRREEARYILGRSFGLIFSQRLLRKRNGGRVALREICVHAPNTEAVILAGSDAELTNYMLSGRDLGMVDFRTALTQIQSQVEPSEYQTYQRLFARG